MISYRPSSDVEITTDPQKMDRDIIFQFLHHKAYWCKGIPYEVCMNSLDHSVPFSVYCNREFCGFARLVTDHSTFAYLGDLFILETFRGKGLGKQLVRTIRTWIEDHGIRTSLLLTRDAQTLYSKYGWTFFDDVNTIMRYKEQDTHFYGEDESSSSS